MSRVRLLSARRRWAIVLALSVASFVAAQRASASPGGIPSAAYRCMYAELWIGSQAVWGLHLQPTERSALQGMPSTCST